MHLECKDDASTTLQVHEGVITDLYPPLRKDVIEAVSMLSKTKLRNIQQFTEYEAMTMPDSNPHSISRRNIQASKVPSSIVDQEGFLINQRVCDDDTVMVVVVCSAVYRFEQRKVIRKTWASVTKDPLLRTKLVFMLAVHPDPYMQKYVIEESVKHEDIIQDNFIDSYQNLSLKSIGMLKWFGESSCRNVKYLLKTDDDMFVNIPNLLKDIAFRESFQPIKWTIMGHLQIGARPDLDPQSKWFTPKSKFHKKTYPDYCSGTAYVLTNDIINALYKAALNTPIFWLEDVYITGILAEKVKAKHIQNHKFDSVGRERDPCVLRTIISVHRVNSIDLQKIWTGINNDSLICDYPTATNVDNINVRDLKLHKNKPKR
ncbi:unnamed protein product [Owenia fusiformis]|uniref:Hexosyltransferase n=1 Tax=Owenia fusiformis TaxID=6347 RepID=A0A8S4MWA5_OWEFU|nr:unnamed protein product [Owenia fusiformis]